MSGGGVALCGGVTKAAHGNSDREVAELAGYGEFVAANSTDDIGFTECFLEQFRRLAERGRADSVAVDVIDLFQVIQIYEQNGKRGLRALCQAKGLLGKDLESSQVVKACQLIAKGQVVNLGLHA